MTLTLKQFEARGQARIYLDMDGVLCDFIKGVKDTTGIDFTSPDLNRGEKGKIKQQIEDKGEPMPPEKQQALDIATS